MGNLPEKYIDDYKTSYAKAANRLIRDFSTEFCNLDGTINWEKLVDFNSGSPKRKAREELLQNALDVYNWMKAEPTSSKKKLQTETNLGGSAVNRAISYLTAIGIVTKGYDGKNNGWTINKDFEVNADYFD